MLDDWAYATSGFNFSGHPSRDSDRTTSSRSTQQVDVRPAQAPTGGVQRQHTLGHSRKRGMSIVQQLAIKPETEPLRSRASQTSLQPAEVRPRRSHSYERLRTKTLSKTGGSRASVQNWLNLDESQFPHLLRFNLEDSKRSSYDINYEMQLIEAQLSKYTQFTDGSVARIQMCSTRLSEAESLLKHVSSLSSQIDSIVSETRYFEKTCHDLVAERDALLERSRQIDSRLQLFNNLDVVTRQLHAPGTSLAGRRKAFTDVLSSIDSAMEFFDKHPNYMGTEYYRTRYSQCLGRALAMARDFFCIRIREKAEYVQRRSKGIGNAEMGSATHLALIYANFEGDSSLMKAVTEDIRMRCSYFTGSNEADSDIKHTSTLYALYGNTYDPLYESCFKTYLAIRSRILVPYIAQNFAETSGQPFVESCWGNISFYRELYRQEWELYKLFFQAVEPFSAWVADIGEQLQDAMRRRIIREQNIESLCELTSLLLDLLDTGNNHYDFILQFRPILEDVQSRLVFRVQSVIENEIIRYHPKSEDFAEGSRRGRKSLVANGDGQTPLSVLSQSWYEPLRRSVMLLSQIYRLVNSHVFDDLAHRIVHECLASLERARAVAVSRLGKVEGQLFLIQNLLILQTQIVEFDIGYVPPELQFDFSAIQELFSSITSQGVSFGVESLLNLARASVPRVVSNMVDAKQELYARLRNAIHDFTEECIRKVADPVLSTSLDTALQASAEFRQHAKKELPRIRSIMENYIDDIRTRNILMDSIQDLMIQTYGKFHSEVVRQALEAQNPGSDVLNELMDVEGLVSWLGVIVGEQHMTA